MNLTLAKLIGKITHKQIYRESKSFHVRGIATDISDNDDVHATDWIVCSDPSRGTHDGSGREFYILSESWYASSNQRPGIVDDIVIKAYGNEFLMVWHQVGDKVFPRLEVFDGSWMALSQCRDLLEIMAAINDKDVSVKDFAQILLSLGFKDSTKRKEKA